MSKIPFEKRLPLHVDKTYFRSIEQLSGSSEFTDAAGREFPEGASELSEEFSRRGFLQLMGASVALAGAQACRRPVEKILPYPKAKEALIPGEAQFYASTFTLGTHATGMLVESHEGRPTKIEGNPNHPWSAGAADAWMQASVLGLYDQDRSKSVLFQGKPSTYTDFKQFLAGHLQALKSQNGQGFVVLSETIASPTLAALRTEFLKTYPQAQWLSYDPVNQDQSLLASWSLFGRALRPVYQLDHADVVLSIGHDFLQTSGGHVRYSRDFMAKRKVDAVSTQMARLYVVESAYSATGAMADHRYKTQYSKMGAVLAQIAHELFLVQGLALASGIDADLFKKSLLPFAHAEDAQWVSSVSRDLLSHRGQSLVMVGDELPADVHALAMIINFALTNQNATFVLHAVPEYQSQPQFKQMLDLVSLMGKNQVNTLVMLGGNPVFTCPVDLGFEKLLKNVKHTIHLADRVDETSLLVNWHVPRAHVLESWSDAVAFDGLYSLVQPLIQPLYQAKTDIELVALLLGSGIEQGYEFLKANFVSFLQHGTSMSDLSHSIPATFSSQLDMQWNKSLHDGLVDDVRLAPLVPQASFVSGAGAIHILSEFGSGFELVYLLSAQIFDGRFSNNPWLQELPDAMTKLTWDNALLISPKTAQKLGVKTEDMLLVQTEQGKMELPVWVQPGQADDSLAIALGFGSKKQGLVAAQFGFDVYKLRSSKNLWCEPSVKVSKSSKTYVLASTQDHHYTEDRPMVIEGDFKKGEHKIDLPKAKKLRPHLFSLFQGHEKKGHQWGLVIDLNQCVGCNACTTACQAENNIPVVGKEQVKRGREMHWMRLDRYFVGKESSTHQLDNPHMVHQPVMCMHCEDAPCEQVCPVAATTHSPEGLNDIAYNRCIGTRYCANNCPYKVRRFNFLDWHQNFIGTHANEPGPFDLQHNPNVTVRMRGVMEKCNYCVQRINSGKIKAKVAGKPLQDGDITTACAQTCPTQAIVFGDIQDPKSRIAQLKASQRNYEMLADLNVKPRTSYLVKLRNLNPELVASTSVPMKDSHSEGNH